MIHEFNLVDAAYIIGAVVLSLTGVVSGLMSTLFGYFWWRGCFK